MPPRFSRAMTMDGATSASARNKVRSLKDRMAAFQALDGQTEAGGVAAGTTSSKTNSGPAPGPDRSPGAWSLRGGRRGTQISPSGQISLQKNPEELPGCSPSFGRFIIKHVQTKCPHMDPVKSP